MCDVCRQLRTLEHVVDYSPIQVILLLPLGWYSGADGEICGDCMAQLIGRANGARS